MEPIMTDFDRKAVDKLKSTVADIITVNFNDFDLLRWLQGHDYNYDFVVPKLQHHFRFMKSYDFSRHKSNTVVEEYWPSGMLGLSGKDDNFVYTISIGTLDGDGILKSTSIYSLVLNRFFHFENEIMKSMRNHEKETGRQSGIILIQDMEKAPMNSSSLAMVAEPYRLYLNAILTHYADILNKCIVVNAPAFMQIV